MNAGKRGRGAVRLHVAALWAAGIVALNACGSGSQAVISATREPQPSSVLIYDQLRGAFQANDRTARQESVLSLMRLFLADIANRQVDDPAASALLSDIANSSGHILLQNPAYIRRQDTRAVVGLPDGMGLFLFDLSAPRDAAPLQISEWTAGLTSVQVIWEPDEAGAYYVTTGADRATSAHYALARKVENLWQLTWFSDDQPDWWLNNRNAEVSITPDLQTLTMIGEAEHSSAAFVEQANAPRRRFRVEWLRQEDKYQIKPATSGDATRTAWLWQTAEPSAYATLVELIERIRIGDRDGAALLAANPRVVTNAFAFGLDFPENRFQVIAFDSTAMTVRCVRGTFVFTFKPPPPGETRPWLVASLLPFGVASPTLPAPGG